MSDKLRAIEKLVLELVECCIYEKHYKREEVFTTFERLLDDLKEVNEQEKGYK